MPPAPQVSGLASFPWAEALTLAFSFAWGAIGGSFLNVVAHRVPRGESVVGGRSRCPRCGTRIAARDNVPVLGWLWLGGRCRACRTAIAASYPLVEATCGVLATLVAVADVLVVGRGLPGGAPGIDGVVRLLERGDWSAGAAWIVHTGMLLVLVAWALLDRAGVPPRGVTAGWVIGTAAAACLALPTIGPPAVGGGWSAGTARATTALAIAAGAAAGSLWALPARGRAVRHGLPLVGVVLGWQTVTVVAIVTALASRAERRLAGTDAGPARGGPWLVAATAAAILVRPAWRAVSGG